MNLNDSEFEQQLRALRPAAPPRALQEAIASDLKPREILVASRLPTAGVLARPAPLPRAFPGFLRGFGWAFAGACVAVAAIVFIEREPTPPRNLPVAAVEPTPAFDLAESTAEIISAEDEGLVYSDDEAPARRVRYSSIERHVWTNASTGARMEVEIPREDIRLMPVAMQ